MKHLHQVDGTPCVRSPSVSVRTGGGSYPENSHFDKPRRSNPRAEIVGGMVGFAEDLAQDPEDF
jgi:hypothetical protein